LRLAVIENNRVRSRARPETHRSSSPREIDRRRTPHAEFSPFAVERERERESALKLLATLLRPLARSRSGLCLVSAITDSQLRRSYRRRLCRSKKSRSRLRHAN
jgi:hypothetical protein